MKKNIKQYLLATSVLLLAVSCQKMNRPALGDYTKDANPPGGPLKFYVAFDGTTPDPLRNAVDSIRANFASSNPLLSITGITGKGIQGAAAKDKAVKYTSANDFAKSTSFTIAYWMKNSPATDGEPEFHFSLPGKDYWHNSALFLLVEKGDPVNPNLSTPTQMACKLAIKDNWVEFIGVNRLPNLLNGSWHHLVFTYDQTNSKVTAYVDGVVFNYTGSGNIVGGGNPLGPAKFFNDAQDNINSFVIGGWNKHAVSMPDGFKGPQDGWIHSYSGAMDQFRLYSKALSASEVLALFNSKL